MSVAQARETEPNSARVDPMTQDAYIRMQDILVLYRGRLPAGGVPLNPAPGSDYDCRVVASHEIQQFRLNGPEQWADYRTILDAFDDARREGSANHATPLPPDIVFSPVKILISERSEPLRAALIDQPAYPERGRIGALRPGQSPWMAYAAMAVLNSDVGQALYRRTLVDQAGRLRARDEVSIRGLRDLPVASVTRQADVLERVASLSYRLTVLHEVQRRWPERSLEKPVQATRERLLGEVCRLLDFSETEVHKLLESVDDLHLKHHPAPGPRAQRIRQAIDLAPLSPIRLVTPEERKELARLNTLPRADLSSAEALLLCRLLDLEAWEERLTLTPPREIPAEEPPPPYDPPPLSLDQVRGIRLPVSLVSETLNGRLYEYYPIGQHIVAAPGVCGGRATFKYTRIDVRHLLPELMAGEPPDKILEHFRGSVSPEALQEARMLANLNEPGVFERPLVPSDSALDYP